MKTEHTPGTWDTWIDENDDCSIEVDGRIITTLPVKSEEDLANALLIAAAPRLLERVNGLMLRLETIRETDKTGLLLDRDIESARAVLDSALPRHNRETDEIFRRHNVKGDSQSPAKNL